MVEWLEPFGYGAAGCQHVVSSNPGLAIKGPETLCYSSSSICLKSGDDKATKGEEWAPPFIC